MRCARARVDGATVNRGSREMARSLRPDLILSDVMMPGLSGDRTVSKLRRLPDFADVAIVMLTAKAGDDLRVRFLRDGVRDYLSKPVSVEELLARVGVSLSRTTRGELMRETVDASALTELGDPRMIEVALTNNAWKYTSRRPDATITVASQKEDGRCWICVEDNGAGFDPRCASHLFQPFERLHIQDDFPGIGIGLATVQRIVHRHGGQVCATRSRAKARSSASRFRSGAGRRAHRAPAR
jgi:CheY-like chemotaxis protein